MGWIALFMAFDGFLTKINHPEVCGYIYIASGLFAIAESLTYRRDKSS